MPEKEIGKVTHYYSKLSVGIIKLEDALKVGDNIHVKGSTTDFNQAVDSIQLEHKDIIEAKAGDDIGIRVTDHVREHDIVYKVE